MNNVEVIEGEGKRPYMVKVNGQLLRESRNQVRRFKTSIKAAVAGAKEVDRLRGLQVSESGDV